MKTNWKAVSAISVSLTFLVISLGNSADGASTSVASQISALQKKIVSLQTRVSDLENAPAPQIPADNDPSLATTDIYYFGFDSSCKAPADIVTMIPLPSSVVCHLRVVVPSTVQ